jgi:predicted ATP-grasp superfamily ATP-dependent carboligase
VGGRPVLIPTDDVAALFVARHAHALREGYTFPDQPPGLAHRLSNKKLLHELCLEHGIPTARAAFPKSRDDIAAFIAKAQFPVVAKAIDPELLGGRPGAKSVTIIHTADELLAHVEAFADARGANANLMLQEHIPGGSESVWMFNGYFDSTSNCLFGAVGRKLRQYPPYTGMTSLGVCEPNQEVERTTLRFLRDIGYRGIVDMGYRFDERDGRYKLLDVNPRIGAAFRLFVGTNGMDVVRAQHLDLMGDAVPPSEVRPGRRWVAELHDPASAARHFLDGRLSLRAWLRSLRGIEEAASFARDDLPGALASYRADLGRALQDRLRRDRP